MSRLKFAKPKTNAIELGANVNIHNRFDFVIEEKGKPLQEFTLGDKGEFKAQGTSVVTAHNVILDSMWTRLCGRNAFGGYIHLGTGSGTPAATDTNLFTWKLAKIWTVDAQVRGFDEDGVTPLGYWRGYIQLSDSEENGTTFTEVGVGYGTSSGEVTTHAMLQDAEGGTISITKNSSMVLKVYATIYSTITASDSYTILEHPSTNPMLAYLTGGSAPTMTYYLSSGRANTLVQKFCDSHRNQPDISASKTLTLSADTINKRSVGASATFSRTEGLINNINSVALSGIGMVNINNYDNPNFAGVPVIDEVIGTGDGKNRFFPIPANNAEPESDHHYLATVTGAVGYAQGDVCTGTIGGVEFTVKSVDLNFALTSCSPSFGDVDISGSVALAGGTGSGATLTIETVTAPYSSTHNQLGMTVHSNALPAYMSDNYSVNFAGIANYYFARSSLIKDEQGNYKSYLIKSDTVVARMYKGQQWEASTAVPFAGSNYAYALSPDGFGTDDGYAFNFADGKMRIGIFENDSFYFDVVNELDVVYDTPMPETIRKVYVYKDRKFLLVSDTYVAMYQQTSQNEFMQLWIVQNTDTSLLNRNINYCDHIYKDNKLYSVNRSTMPSEQLWNALVYDSTNDVYVVTCGNDRGATDNYPSNVYAVGKYNTATGTVDWTQGTMPSSQRWNALVYDSTNDVYVVTCGGFYYPSNVYAVGKYNTATGTVDWTQSTMPASNRWNALVYDSTNDVYVITSGSGYSSSNAYAVGKYNTATGTVDWTQSAMPSSQIWNALVYDSTNDVYVVTCGVGWDRYNNTPSNVYAVGKYNTATGTVDWTQGAMPSEQIWNALVYDSTNDVCVVTCGGGYSSSNVYAVGKYNTATGTVDWTQGTMPSSQRWNALVYDSANDVYVVTCGVGYSSSNAYAVGKYNAATGIVDWTQSAMPSSQIWNALVYDSTNDVYVVTCGGVSASSNIYAVGKYSAATSAGVAWIPLTLRCQNISDGSVVPNPSNFLENLPHTYRWNTVDYSFAIMDGQFAIGDTNQPLVRYEYDFPATQRESKFIRSHTANQDMPCTSLPEWGGAIITARNMQYFYNTPGPNRGIGASLETNVQYYSDCIIKANHTLISADTSIPDGSSYVEFDTAPANGEQVKLSYLSRGLNKTNEDNKYYTITVSGYYQFGEQQ